MDIRPDYANLESGTESWKRWIRMTVADRSSVIVVQPGEKVPIDGIVLEGILYV